MAPDSKSAAFPALPCISTTAGPVPLYVVELDVVDGNDGWSTSLEPLAQAQTEARHT